MTPEQIKLNMAVMTPHGKGVVVGWLGRDSVRYLVKIEGHIGHNGEGFSLIAGSNEALDGDGRWFSAEDLTAIEEPTHYAEWKKLTTMPDKEHPDEKEGTKFVVVFDACHSHFIQGDIVELIKNDKSDCPLFKLLKSGENHDCFWYRLAKLPQSQTDEPMAEQSNKNLSRTLENRESQYGPFKSQSLLTQTMLGQCVSHKNWGNISADKKEAIHMILHKIARIVNGNQNNVDSWHDIQGYAKLVEDDLKS